MNTYDIAETHQAVYHRAMRGRSLAAAARAHCLMCGNWVSPEVTSRPAKNCPLRPYRLTGSRVQERPRGTHNGELAYGGGPQQSGPGSRVGVDQSGAI